MYAHGLLLLPLLWGAPNEVVSSEAPFGGPIYVNPHSVWIGKYTVLEPRKNDEDWSIHQELAQVFPLEKNFLHNDQRVLDLSEAIKMHFREVLNDGSLRAIDRAIGPSPGLNTCLAEYTLALMTYPCSAGGTPPLSTAPVCVDHFSGRQAAWSGAMTASLPFGLLGVKFQAEYQQAYHIHFYADRVAVNNGPQLTSLATCVAKLAATDVIAIEVPIEAYFLKIDIQNAASSANVVGLGGGYGGVGIAGSHTGESRVETTSTYGAWGVVKPGRIQLPSLGDILNAELGDRIFKTVALPYSAWEYRMPVRFSVRQTEPVEAFFGSARGQCRMVHYSTKYSELVCVGERSPPASTEGTADVKVQLAGQWHTLNVRHKFDVVEVDLRCNAELLTWSANAPQVECRIRSRQPLRGELRLVFSTGDGEVIASKRAVREAGFTNGEAVLYMSVSPDMLGGPNTIEARFIPDRGRFPAKTADVRVVRRTP